MEITEKVAYLKGLVDGLGVDDSTKEGKIIKVVVDLLDDMALTMADTDDTVEALSDQVDLMEDELIEIMEDLYEGDDDEGCGCGGHHHHHHGFDGELYEVTCPACGDTVCVDEDMLDEGEIECPGCGEALEFDLSGVLDDYDTGDADDEEDE